MNFYLKTNEKIDEKATKQIIDNVVNTIYILIKIKTKKLHV